jgi:hypothetical protein
VRAALFVCTVVAWSASAHAETVDELAQRGEALAKQGEWTQAIAAFKAADAVRPRARHACLIGLAYLRREQWAEAELFLTTCRERASASDPLPEWIDEADAQLRTKLAASGTAAVAIAVAPVDANAQIKFSGFAPDESFAPRMIHLAPGRYSILVTAPGYRTVERVLVVGSAAPQLVTIELRSASARNLVPLAIGGVGLAILAGGFAYDTIVVQPIRTDIANAKTIAFYDDRRAALATPRAITIAMWSVGGAAIAVAAVLRATAFGRHAPRVDASPTRGGGVVSLEWTR